MLHSLPTLVFKPLIPFGPFCNFSLCPLATGYPSTPPASFSPLTLLGLSNGMLEVFELGALNYFTFFCPILLILSVSRNPILAHLLFSAFSALRSDCTHSWSGILSRDATHASSGVIIFVRQGLSFSELVTSSFSSLDLYFEYVGVNISLNKSSSLPVLNVYAPLIFSSPTGGRTDFFFSSILPSSRNLFILGDFNCHHPFGTQEVLPTPTGRKYSIRSSPLTSSPLMTLTHPPFYTAHLVVAPPLIFPLIPLPLPFFAHGRCFKTSVLTVYHFFYLPLSLRSFALTSVLLPLIFRKLAKMIFSYFDSRGPSAKKYSSLSLSYVAALFPSLALNADKSSIPFSRIKHHPKA